MIECKTLGTWELTVDGAAPPADLTWKKNFALMVYLARSPKRTRSRDHLLGLLWADKPEHDARRSLNVALSTLRQRLGPATLHTDGDHVRLDAGAVQLDVERFESLAQAGDLRGAAALAGGEFLSGFSVADASEFENWLLAERTSVRWRSLDVLTRRANHELDGGAVDEAERLAGRALALDPLFEPAVRTVIRARALAGDRAGALAFYAAFKARLAAQLGTLPDRETEALAERVRRERVRPVPGADPEHGGRAGRVPLEGRAESLAQALAAWRVCLRERRPTVVIIEGDAGMGKTRLAEEVATRARVDGAAVATIRAVEADLAAPWSGVLGLCRGGLYTAPGVAGASPAALAALHPEVTASPPLGRAFSEVIAAVCEEQPLVLVLDDAQWLDRESLLAVVATTRDLAHAPLAVVVTTVPAPPPSDLDAVRARFGRDVAGSAVALGPLLEESVARLAAWALPECDADQLARVTRRVCADSAGIPLLAVALLQAVAAGLDLGEAVSGWPLPGRTLDQTLPGDLPDSIVGAIRVMFGRTSADAQKVLVVAAVLGGRVPAGVLGRGAELVGDRLTAALDELEWSQWLTMEPRGYAFAARIVRDVVARDMVRQGPRRRILDATDGWQPEA